jgi:heme exporter protein C
MLRIVSQPDAFLRTSARVSPWLASATALLLAVGLVLALFVSPPDFRQSESVRIMYVHVPAAWMSLFCYTLMAGASAVALVWRAPLAHIAAEATAPLGAAFTFLALVTGSLWGKPMWGAWWVWDARLTSELILLFLYLGFMALGSAFDEPMRGARASATLAVVGIVMVPIIKYSVDWWSTLHQPASVFRMSGPTIAAEMLVPLLIMGIGYTTFFLYVLLIRMTTLLNNARIRALQMRQVQGWEVAR